MTTLEEYNKMFEESEKIGKEAIIDCIGFIVKKINTDPEMIRKLLEGF